MQTAKCGQRTYPVRFFEEHVRLIHPRPSLEGGGEATHAPLRNVAVGRHALVLVVVESVYCFFNSAQLFHELFRGFASHESFSELKELRSEYERHIGRLMALGAVLARVAAVNFSLIALHFGLFERSEIQKMKGGQK